MAVASLVLGILSIVLIGVPFLPIVLGIIGIIFGGIRKYWYGDGTAGLVCSIIGASLSFVYSLVWLILIEQLAAALSLI